MPTRAPAAALLAALLLASCGRQERIIEVTTTPPGAIVWLNDVELGRTPVQAEFLHFGTYDIRLHLEGYEPIVTSRDADAPLGEIPPFDFASAIIPGTHRTRLQWHFDLTPIPETANQVDAERQLVDRANAFRQSSPSTPASATPQAASAPK